MWLIATMHPPVAGIFSPSIQVREVAASSVGLRIDAATVIAHPRSCSSFLTRTRHLSLARRFPLPAAQATRSEGSRTACAALVPGGRIGGDVSTSPAIREPGADDAG